MLYFDFRSCFIAGLYGAEEMTPGIKAEIKSAVVMLAIIAPTIIAMIGFVLMLEGCTIKVITKYQPVTDTLFISAYGFTPLDAQRDLIKSHFTPQLEVAVLQSNTNNVIAYQEYKILKWGGNWIDSVSAVVECGFREIPDRYVIEITWKKNGISNWWSQPTSRRLKCKGKLMSPH